MHQIRNENTIIEIEFIVEQIVARLWWLVVQGKINKIVESNSIMEYGEYV